METTTTNNFSGLSIITPHYNDTEGLKRIYDCLKAQTDSSWEWVIVDDCSGDAVQSDLREWISHLDDQRLRCFLNKQKTNASICRNLGANETHYQNLVFLDADDYIKNNFVEHRHIDVEEFVVYKNMGIDDARDGLKHIDSTVENYLSHFLAADFIWQTTCILWNRKFFTDIGGFDPDMERLQDVELSIRALLLGKRYNIVDNAVDFYYCTKPIRLKHDIVRKSCQSVNHLITKLKRDFNLDMEQYSKLKSFYFACVKGLHRTKNRKEIPYLVESLRLFRSKKIMSIFEYGIGRLLLLFYKYRLISDALFIRSNRFIFKKV